MKRILTCVVLLLVPITVVMAQTKTGYRIGKFSLESGDGKQIASSDLSGRVTVLFYETKDNRELNRPAKDQLNNLFRTLNDNVRNKIIRLPVIDCSGVFWPFTGIWKNQLVENSKIEGMDIYGDWDGNMKKIFSFDKNEVYLIIIDQKETVCFFKKGQLNQTEIGEAENVLASLLSARE